MRLYDTDSTLEITKDIAFGFLVLLRMSDPLSNPKNEKQSDTSSTLGGKSYEEKSVKREELSQDENPSDEKCEDEQSSDEQSLEEDSSLELAFMAITNGNVIDATFGVESTGGSRRSKNTSSVAFNASQNAKRKIVEASECCDGIVRLAVQVYCKCFEIVIAYQTALNEIGYLRRCLEQQKIRDGAEKELRALFAPLDEAVLSST